MSLFEAREWWSTAVESSEEFVHGAIAVGNVDNSADGNGEIHIYSWLAITLRVSKG